MDRKYWETIAPTYDTEIFDVLQNDTSGSIIAAIDEIASPGKTVIDIGCAIGKWICTGAKIPSRYCCRYFCKKFTDSKRKISRFQ